MFSICKHSFSTNEVVQDRALCRFLTKQSVSLLLHGCVFLASPEAFGVEVLLQPIYTYVHIHRQISKINTSNTRYNVNLYMHIPSL